ncbi:MAG TPA: ABC transporter permease, partial [Patescibacteria group bacterium]|nr:ABC transporter permease [Patescibacteria group bacterium]
LSLAIGANTAMFALVDAVLFHPLHGERASELWRVLPIHDEVTGWSYPAYGDLREGADTVAALAAWSDATPVHLSRASGRAERIPAAFVSGNFFTTVGARPRLGRLLTDADDAPGAGAAVVISDRLWRRSFGADLMAVGQVVRINGRPHAVVGIAPAGFTGASLESFPDLWIPLSTAEQVLTDFADLKPLTRRGFCWLNLTAVLRPDTGAAAAAAQMQGLVTGGRTAAGGGSGPLLKGVRLVPAAEAALGFETVATGRMRVAGQMLFGVVMVVLAIACANAAGLLLVRGERRGREIAIRRAVGASRARIVRQLLVESLMLGALAAGGGLLVASWGVDLARTLAPKGALLPLEAARDVGNPRVLFYGVAVAVLTSLTFGLAPALSAARVDLTAALTRNAAAGAGRRARPALREALVGVEIALAVVLLAGAGLLLRTLMLVGAVDPGFAVEHRLTASLDPGLQGYDRARTDVLYTNLLEAARALPDVRSAALAHIVPIEKRNMATSVEYEGYAGDQEHAPIIPFDVVTPGFFRTMGMPLLRGRDFADGDTATAAPVVIVNESFAKRFWPDQDPIGKRIRNLGEGGGLVVGLVRDARLASLRAAPEPYLFVPLAQFHVPSMSIVLETTGDPAAILPSLAATVARLDKDLPLYGAGTLGARLGAARGQERFLAALLGAFACLALILAGAGLYGVTAYATEARTREFGIRMALGAPRGHVLGLVLRRTAWLAFGGAVAGLLGAASLAGLFRSLLFGVGRADPLTFGISLAVLGAVTLLACGIPARRATRVDPLVALRCD